MSVQRAAERSSPTSAAQLDRLEFRYSRMLPGASAAPRRNVELASYGAPSRASRKMCEEEVRGGALEGRGDLRELPRHIS